MAVNLSPVGGAAAQFFDNNGNPLAGGKLYTYAAGTTTPLATYTTSVGNVAHTNPIILDSAGRVPGGQIWLTDGSVDYKFLLETSFSVLVGTFDNIPSTPSVSASDIAVVASTYNAGTTVQAQLTNVGSTTGATNVGYTPAGTGAVATTVQAKLRESISLADFLPVGYVTDASIDYTTQINNAIAAAVAGPQALYIPKGEWRHSAVLPITGRIVIHGEGKGVSKFLSVNCDGFNISNGVTFVTIRDITIAQAVRYTTTPNAYTAINNNGTTLVQNTYHTYENIFIDGFGFGFSCTAVSSSSWINCQTAFTHESMLFSLQCLNNAVSNCQFSETNSMAIPPAAGSYGIKVGDGTVNCEGIMVTNCLVFGVDRGIWVRASIDVFVNNCILDGIFEFGILAQSTGTQGCFNNIFSGNYIGAAGAATSVGIYLLNSFAANASFNNGTVVSDNEILAYTGKVLNYGIFVEGAAENRNSITGNRISNTNTFDCRITTGTQHKVSGNTWRSAIGFSTTVAIPFIQYINNSGQIATEVPNPIGLFTPTVRGSSTAGVFSYAGDSRHGSYKIIDNLCFFSLFIVWTAMPSAAVGTLQITGLPVLRKTDATYAPPINISVESIVFPEGATAIFGFVRSGEATIELRGIGSNLAPTPVDAVQADGTIRVSGFYEIL